jgi:hypothetical protein
MKGDVAIEQNQNEMGICFGTHALDWLRTFRIRASCR